MFTVSGFEFKVSGSAWHSKPETRNLKLLFSSTFLP